jgi:hypothetical protein
MLHISHSDNVSSPHKPKGREPLFVSYLRLFIQYTLSDHKYLEAKLCSQSIYILSSSWGNTHIICRYIHSF